LLDQGMNGTLLHRDGAFPAGIAGGMIRERARLSKGELEGGTLRNRTAIKHAGRIRSDRVRGRVIVCPGNGITDLDLQGIGLVAGTGNGHQIGSFGRWRSVSGLDMLGG